MATAKKSISKKLIEMVSKFSQVDVADLDAEIKQIQGQLNRLNALREMLHGRARKPAPEEDEGDSGYEDEDVEPTVVLTDSDKDMLRRKLVTYLKCHGIKRNDFIARDLEVTKEAVMELLNHKWFAKANQVGGYTLAAEGHVESNRLAGR